MAKDKKDRELRVEDVVAPAAALTSRAYEEHLFDLHIELVKLQEWVQRTGAKVCVVFEGRDSAGKGGTIKALTDRVSPRVFRVVALPSPTDREKSQMYIQRYVPHLPAAGGGVIFGSRWFNPAGGGGGVGFFTRRQTPGLLPL